MKEQIIDPILYSVVLLITDSFPLHIPNVFIIYQTQKLIYSVE